MSKSAFWSSIRKEASDFEKAVSTKGNNFRSPPCIWQSPKSYHPHNQLYIKRTGQKGSGGFEKIINGQTIIPDDAHLKHVFDDDGDLLYNTAIIHDSKLSGGEKAWTKGQYSDLIEPFRLDSNLEFIEYEIRSSQSKLNEMNSSFQTGQKIRVYRDAIFKTIKIGNDPLSTESITGKIF